MQYHNPYQQNLSHRRAHYGGGLLDPVSGASNAQDDDTYRKSNTFWNRAKNSLAFAVCGCVFFCLSLYLIFWNEGQAVGDYKTATNRYHACIDLDSRLISRVGPGEIVYVSGPVSTGSLLIDNDFQLQAPVVRLRREVEMYQWIEERGQHSNAQSGESHPYTYSQVWSKDHIDSRDFHDKQHSNPRSAMFAGRIFDVRDVRIGVYRLDPYLVAKLDNWQALDLSLVPYSTPARLRVSGRYFYTGDPSVPRVGDARISFSYIGVGSSHSDLGPQDYISAIGGLRNDSIVPLQMDSHTRVGLAVIGQESLDSLFDRAYPVVHTQAWPLRTAALFATWFSIFIMRGLIQHKIFGLLPVLSRMSRHPPILFAFFLALIVVLAVSASVWFRLRPIFSSLLCVAAFGVLFLGIRTGTKKAA